MSIPKDPVILLSYINTQLRDYYTDLNDLCKSLSLEKKEILSALESIDYKYDAGQNQFI